jgi:hypothetical protein
MIPQKSASCSAIPLPVRRDQGPPRRIAQVDADQLLGRVRGDLPRRQMPHQAVHGEGQEREAGRGQEPHQRLHARAVDDGAEKDRPLTANPPTLNYYVPGDDPELLAERLTARAYYEYDRSGEAFEFKRGIQMANTFGYTYFKTFFDSVDVERQVRYKTREDDQPGAADETSRLRPRRDRRGHPAARPRSGPVRDLGSDRGARQRTPRASPHQYL